MDLSRANLPLVSVVTVVLNGEKYIENTILSVTGQTYGRIEYIIIDGESTDGTLDIIKKYENHIDHLVSEPDYGIYDAMNKAIDIAAGRWINFMNCGDAYDNKDIIKTIFSEIPADVDVIYGDTRFVYPDGTKRIFRAKKLEKFWKGLRFYHQSVFVKTDLLKLNKFDLNYQIAADFDFLLNLYQRKYNFIDTKMVISNMMTGGLSYNRRVQAFQECRKAVRKHFKNGAIERHYSVLILKVRLNFLIRKMLSPKAFMFVLHMKDKVIFFSELLQLGILTKTFQLIILLFKDLLRRLYSDETFYGYHFDLMKTAVAELPEISVNLRLLQQSDIPVFFDFKKENFTAIELRKALECLAFINSGIPSCYVGTTADGLPCVMCWLLEPERNREIQSYFRQGIPTLKTDEVLCEYIFTQPKYRGYRLMGWITSKLFEIASQKGFRRAIAFVHEKNAVSLKTTPTIGWQPFLIKKVHWRIFRRQITFERFADDECQVSFCSD